MFILAEIAADGLGQITSLGAAGVMGAMWFFERRNAQQRDRQLDEAHARIMGDRVEIDQLIEVVRSNAEALTRLSSVQDQLVRTLERGGRAGPG